MLRCVRYELLKIFSRKLIPVLWGCLLLANGLLFCYEQRDSQPAYLQNREAARELEARYAAMPAKEAVAELEKICAVKDALYALNAIDRQQEPELIREQIAEIYRESPQLGGMPEARTAEELTALLPLYDSLYRQYAWAAEYPAYLDYVQEQAETMQRVNIFGGAESFSGRNAAKTATDFEKCRGLPVTVGNDRYLEAVNAFRAVDLLAVLFLLAVTSILFLEEQENGQTRLLRSTRNGRLTTAWAKLAAGMLLAAACVLTFYAEVLLLSGVFYGFPEWGRWVQSIRSFRECSVPLTVIQYLLLFLLQKGAGCALLVLAFAFLTLLFRSGKLAYLAAALTGGAEFLCCRLLHPASLFNPLKFLNIFYILNPARIYTEYVNLNLFGQPVGIRGGLAVFCAAGAALLIGGVCFLTLHPPEWRWRGLSVRHRPHPERGSTSLLFQEFYRVVFTGRGIFVWLAAAVLIFAWCRELPVISMNYQQAVYKQYITRFAGELTPEKAEEIEAVEEDFQNLSQEFAKLQAAYAAGEISREQYEEETCAWQYFSAQRRDFRAFYTQCLQVRALADRGITPVLLDKTSTAYLFESKKRGALSFAVMVVLLLLAVLPMGGSGENMRRLICSTARGRSALFGRQMGLAAGFSALMAAGRWGPVLWDQQRQYPICCWDAPVQNLEPYMELDIPLTVGSLLALWIGMQLLGAVVYGGWFLIFTQMSGRPTVGALAGLLLIAVTWGGSALFPQLSFLNPAAVYCPLSPLMLRFWPVCCLALLGEFALALLAGRSLCKK